MIGSDLLRYQDNQRYVILDTETEGLSLFHSRPWQLSYAICTNKRIENIVTKYPLYPDINVSEEAAQKTRFDKKKYLEMGEDPVKTLKEFEEVAMDPSVKLVMHNGLGFDVYVWQTMRRLQGKPLDWSMVDRTIDTLALARAFRYGHVPDHSNLLAWQYKMLSIKGSRAKGMGCSLGAMAREFQIPYDERLAHDAAYDLRVTHGVFGQLIWAVDI